MKDKDEELKGNFSAEVCRERWIFLADRVTYLTHARYTNNIV